MNRAKLVTLTAGRMSAFDTQQVRIVAYSHELIPVSYQWKKDGNPIADETSNSIIFEMDINGTGTYTCDVVDTDGQTTTSTNCVMTRIDKDITSYQVPFTVKYNEFHDRGHLQLNYELMMKLVEVVKSTAGNSSLCNKLASKISTDIDNGNLDPIYISFLSMLLNCGTVYIQDSRNGYYTEFYPSQTKNHLPDEFGRMINYW